jgi:hypothetical protein
MTGNGKTFNDRPKCRAAMTFSTSPAPNRQDRQSRVTVIDGPLPRRFFARHRDTERISDGVPAQAAVQAATGSCNVAVSCGRSVERSLTTNHESDKAYL